MSSNESSSGRCGSRCARKPGSTWEARSARAQWRVLRGQSLAAARDGKRIKLALERSLMLDPALQDAYFGIGLYHYYADVAPAFAKMLRWLFLLPGGDRERGLQEMQRARTGGQLLRSDA